MLNLEALKATKACLQACLQACLLLTQGYKRLLSPLDESESAGNEKNLDNARIKKIGEDFNKLRDRFLKPKIKEIRRN